MNKVRQVKELMKKQTNKGKNEQRQTDKRMKKTNKHRKE